MKEIILSHDSKAKLYSVPDEVADQLDQYCYDFAKNWLWQSPYAQKYHRITNEIDCVIFESSDFIAYLNQWLFPNQPSTFVKELDFYGYEIPEEYQNIPHYNF